MSVSDWCSRRVDPVFHVGATVEGFERVPPVYSEAAMQGITVPPTSLRWAEGHVYISPDDDEKQKLGRSQQRAVMAGVRYCLDATGQVTDVKLTRESGLPGWDAKIVAAVEQWRFQPIASTRVCANTEFIYEQHIRE